MKYRRLPRLGWDISEIGYGMWGMGGWTGSDDAESAAALDRAVALGCNFFDTAWAVARGTGRAVEGLPLESRPRRPRVIRYNSLMRARNLSLLDHRSALRAASLVSGVVLVAFHGWLFAGQIADGSLADRWLLFRWIAAAGLIAALAAVRVRGGSIWGRQGIAIWVLAAVLHGPAVAANSSDAFDSLALPETAITSVLQLVASAAAGLALLLLAARFAGRRRQVSHAFDLPLAFAAPGILADGFSPAYASRPPPPKS